MADGILNPIEQLEADFDFEVYTKQEVDALLDEKADKSDTYTKTETDALLDDKADADAVYTKTETDTLLSAKADKSTTLAGYGITDAYTKTQTDTLLNGKADADSIYTKQEIDTKIPSSVGSATKPVYVNGGVVSACTYELNKTVPANAVFTDTTYTAGNGLNLSGTSFSAKAGTNVTVDGNGINVNGNGAVASADSGLVSGGTAYTELRPTLDGTWVKNAQTTATNLQKLEGGIEYLYGLLSHQYDQLKKYINGNYYDYDTDTDSAYTKTVPQGAMPYASLEQIGGRTLVWNQVIPDPTMTDASKWTLPVTPANFTKTASNNVLRVERSTSSTSACVIVASNVVIVPNHIYYITAEIRGDVDRRVSLSLANQWYDKNTTTSFARYDSIITANSTITYQRTGIVVQGVDFVGVGAWVEIKNLWVCDLTLMYGSGNEPTTVAEFTAQFPANYYTYSQGSLLSAGVTEVVSKKADTTTIANYPIPAEVQALEGYGWSAENVYNYVDYERKVFVKNIGKIDLGSLDYNYYSNATAFYAPSPDDSRGRKSGGIACVCARYKTMHYASFAGMATDTVAIEMNPNASSNKRIYIRDDSFETNAEGRAALKESLQGVYLYYELAEPIETDISAYITDDNLIEVESGGSLTFPNSNGTDYQIPVPSAETYMVDLQSAL